MITMRSKKTGAIYKVSFFNPLKPKSSWPQNVDTNAKSITGYAYKTLDMIDAPIGGETKTKDGFEIYSGQYLIETSDSIWAANQEEVSMYLEEITFQTEKYL